MKSLHIRNISEETLQSLKNLALKHHRSLQGELHYLLEQAASFDVAETDESLELITIQSNNSIEWDREDIYGDEGR